MSDQPVAAVPTFHRQATIGNWQAPFWAVYLGISWTWCIGMFLPVLLIRDYGLWAFAAFAIPNVVGAAAMGWVIRSTDSSELFVREHSLACAAFSLVTVCFQAYFVGWMGTKLLGGPTAVGVFWGIVVVFLPLMRLGRGMERWLALLTGLVSWFLLAMVLRYRLDLGVLLPESRSVTAPELVALSVVCVLGFALCPYLDRTFHLARQNLSPGGARGAFGMGFGVVFCSMLVFTVLYADLIGVRRVNDLIVLAIGVHLLVQTAFTAAAHSATARSLLRGGGMLLVAAGAYVVGSLADRIGYGGMPGGEAGYRIFMSFYGLAAPAYVWLCAFRSTGPPTRWQWGVLTGTIISATPFYWLAFIEKQMVWAGAGVGVVLLARLLIGTSRKPRGSARVAAS